MGKRTFIILLSILILLLGVASTVGAATKSTAKMISITGDVQVIRAGGEKPFKAFQNMKLTEGDRIITGKNGVAKVEMDDGLVITLSQNTRIYLSELRSDKGNKQNSVSLQSGAIGSSVKKKLTSNARFEIKTPTAVMGVRGTEFFAQYYDGHVDVRVVEGVIDARINVGRNGEVTGIGAANATSQHVQLTALQQVAFSEGDMASTIPTRVSPLRLEGLPTPLIDRVGEISQESPEAIPTEIMNTINTARQTAINQLENRMNDSKLAGDDLSPTSPDSATANPQTAPPSHVATSSTTTSSSGGGSSSSGGSTRPSESAEFDVEYQEGSYNELNPESITYTYIPGQLDSITLNLNSDVEGISYTATVSPTNVATLNQTANDTIIVSIMGEGEATITIIGKASGYQDYEKTINLMVEGTTDPDPDPTDGLVLERIIVNDEEASLPTMEIDYTKNSTLTFQFSSGDISELFSELTSEQISISENVLTIPGIGTIESESTYEEVDIEIMPISSGDDKIIFKFKLSADSSYPSSYPDCLNNFINGTFTLAEDSQFILNNVEPLELITAHVTAYVDQVGVTCNISGITGEPEPIIKLRFWTVDGEDKSYLEFDGESWYELDEDNRIQHDPFEQEIMYYIQPNPFEQGIMYYFDIQMSIDSDTYILINVGSVTFLW